MRSRLVLFAFVFVALVLLGTFVTGYFLPRQWKVTAHASVAAPAHAVHALLDEPRRYPEWCWWSQAKDPDIRYSFAGPERGVGAVFRWTSAVLGEGTLTLTKSDPATGIAYDLVLTGFGEHPIHGEITLAQANGLTQVDLREGGELDTNPIQRLFRGLMEGKLAVEHSGALGRLKDLAEGRTPAPEKPPK